MTSDRAPIAQTRKSRPICSSYGLLFPGLHLAAIELSALPDAGKRWEQPPRFPTAVRSTMHNSLSAEQAVIGRFGNYRRLSAQPEYRDQH